ncbi:MAG: transcription antitermination factor NusB [Phycisphaerales bacterium]|nr:transcription antitermination factor NusB [Phycisphaerales bacterium]
MSGISRDTRRCALQAIYQFDAVGDSDAEQIRETLEGSRTSETAQSAGFELARGAWEHREESDELVRPLSPEWPTHRQPMIDRNILRIALYEIRHAGTAGKVAINGAVELAKEFGGEKSFGFVNAVLDRIWKDDSSIDPSQPGEG